MWGSCDNDRKSSDGKSHKIDKKMEVLSGVLHSVVLYGDPVWSRALEIKKIQNKQ